jgi:hypothetical protein
MTGTWNGPSGLSKVWSAGSSKSQEFIGVARADFDGGVALRLLVGALRGIKAEAEQASAPCHPCPFMKLKCACVRVESEANVIGDALVRIGLADIDVGVTSPAPNLEAAPPSREDHFAGDPGTLAVFLTQEDAALSVGAGHMGLAVNFRMAIRLSLALAEESWKRCSSLGLA